MSPYFVIHHTYCLVFVIHYNTTDVCYSTTQKNIRTPQTCATALHRETLEHKYAAGKGCTNKNKYDSRYVLEVHQKKNRFKTRYISTQEILLQFWNNCSWWRNIYSMIQQIHFWFFVFVSWNIHVVTGLLHIFKTLSMI